MQKQRIEHDSPLEALVAVSKRLSALEARHRMASEDFFDQYTKGQMEDSADFIEWANDYHHFVALKLELERTLRLVA